MLIGDENNSIDNILAIEVIRIYATLCFKSILIPKIYI